MNEIWDDIKYRQDECAQVLENWIKMYDEMVKFSQELRGHIYRISNTISELRQDSSVECDKHRTYFEEQNPDLQIIKCVGGFCYVNKRGEK